MCFEVKDAIRWLLANLRDRSGLTEASQVLRLEAINTDHEEGKRIHRAASKILERLGTPGSDRISLEQVRRVKVEAESRPISEAGVVLPEAAEDPQIRQFMTDIVATLGGAPHPSGRPGVSQAQLDAFAKQARAYLDWRARGGIPAGQTRSAVMPLGARTPEAFGLYASLRGKIDEYFAQCEAVAFSPAVAEQIWANSAERASVDFSDPAAIRAFLEKAPLAKPRPDRLLCLDEELNPHYAAALAELKGKVLEPALGGDAKTLSEAQWQQVKDLFAAHEAWLKAKAGAAVERLGPGKLKEYLDERFSRTVQTLIARRAETAIELDNIRLAEKLILYQANLLTLANNFVSFPHLYDPARRALFEMGTLIMDGRHFNMSVKVADRAAHSSVAKTSNIFVLYVEVLPAGDEKYEVAVPVTSGGRGNLCVGKRGVFQDVAGRERDARVVQIIENPISISEALVSPFQRLGRLITGKIEAMATVAEKKLDATAAGAVDLIQKGPAQPAPAARPGAGLMAGGLLMGGGVAIAALGSAAAYITKTLASINKLKLLIGVFVAILAVMVPYSVMAFVKLRKRDLSAILEGSGWAINARMRLTFRQGRFFTQQPRLPAGAWRIGARRGRWGVVAVAIVVLLALGWYVGRRWMKSAPTPATQAAPAGTPASSLAPAAGRKPALASLVGSRMSGEPNRAAPREEAASVVAGTREAAS